MLRAWPVCLNCTAQSDSVCANCPPVPNAKFLSFSNCSWACDSSQHVFRFGERCLPCNTSNCPLGSYMSQCTAFVDSVCTFCDSNPLLRKPANSVYVQTVSGDCSWICNRGFYQNQTICVPCTTASERSCQAGTIFVPCSEYFDSFCSSCGASQYEAVPGVVDSCVPCNQDPCPKDQFQYRGDCGQYTNALCLPCTLGPAHAVFSGSAVPYNKNNCSVGGCILGYAYEHSTAECEPCGQGTYSSNGLICVGCGAGKYSTAVMAISEATCVSCAEGTYFNGSGASSHDDCILCAVGTYQTSQGQAVCINCPVNTYGTILGATSCTQCPSTSDTRGQSGQAYITACICTDSFYRFNITDLCHECPTDLICYGNRSYTKLVPNSIWQYNGTNLTNGSILQLLQCPVGYLFMKPSTWPYSVDVQKSQSCTPCPAGYECSNPPCYFKCTPCKPGYFKNCGGTQNCTPCDVGSYQPNNGSTACMYCRAGLSTKNATAQVSNQSCTCDTSHYTLDMGSTCQQCPKGLTCFGDSSVVPVALQAGHATWSKGLCGNENIYILTNCSQGYRIQQPWCLSKGPDDLECPYPCNQNADQQCTQCPIGEECRFPPCKGACDPCPLGYWKAALYPSDASPGFYMNAFTSPNEGTDWISQSCAECPIDTYRQLEGGTEIGSCLSCPPRSTTNKLVAQTSILRCECESAYYLSVDYSYKNSSVLSLLIATNPSATFCQVCPPSAVCAVSRSCALRLVCPNSSTESSCFDGAEFTLEDSMCPGEGQQPIGGLVANSIWRVNGSLWRLVQCPPGYTFRPGAPGYPENDECVACEPGTYLTMPTNDSRVSCLPCPIGAKCPGLDVLLPENGYWKMAPGSGRRTIAAGDTSPSPVEVFKCPIGACNGSNCLNNRVGPVCGLCPDGWAISTTGCIPCPTGYALDTLRILGAVLGSILLFVLYLLLAWDHLLPERFRGLIHESKDRLEVLNKKREKLKKRINKLQKLWDKVEDKKDAVKTRLDAMQERLNNLIQNPREQFRAFVPYIKLYITFYQVRFDLVSTHLDIFVFSADFEIDIVCLFRC